MSTPSNPLFATFIAMLIDTLVVMVPAAAMTQTRRKSAAMSRG